MIATLGRVEWDDVVVELRPGDDWRVSVGGVDQPAMAEAYRVEYAGRFQGPAYGYPGAAALQDIANRNGGVATFPEYPHDPNVAY